MEESENPKPWFITHDGERSGPYSMDDLKAKAELHELNPRLDMLWKEGMDDWVPAGEVGGLFKKNTEAEAVEKKKENPVFNEFDEHEESDRHDDDQEWEGTSRGGFFFFVFVFPVIWLIGLFYGARVLEDFLADDLLKIVVGCLALLPLFTGIFAVLQRFQNLAMSRFWFFGMIVPILSSWLGYRLFACPPGYAEHKRLGVLGWILAVMYWLPTIAALGTGVMAVVKGPEMFNDLIEKNRAQYEEYLEKMKEVTGFPEEVEAPEAEEKGPTIIPIKK